MFRQRKGRCRRMARVCRRWRSRSLRRRGRRSVPWSCCVPPRRSQRREGGSSQWRASAPATWHRWYTRRRRGQQKAHTTRAHRVRLMSVDLPDGPWRRAGGPGRRVRGGGDGARGRPARDVRAHPGHSAQARRRACWAQQGEASRPRTRPRSAQSDGPQTWVSVSARCRW